jgi:peptide/nickel transport system permease protein
MDPSNSRPTPSTFSRVAKYVTFRGLTLALMVSIGIFLAIVVINLGGYIDEIHRADIDETLNFLSLSNPGVSREELLRLTEEIRWQMEEAYGLHKPFLLRCVKWWSDAITLNWGVTYKFGITGFSSGFRPVRDVILERLPYTLMLAGATNFLLFFASMFAATRLAKKNGSFIDRLTVSLSPLSAIPNWVYGIILVVIFAGELHLLPFNGLYDTFPPATKLGYVPIVLRHMILPVSAIFLSMFFSTLYTWRTFFLIHEGEDYMELAYAKGVPARMLDRRYVIKPTLPYIITSFMILIITFWQGIIVLEVLFDWPGIGSMFLEAVSRREVNVTIGIVTVFALLLGFSVFLLDIVYALVDPRVKVGGDSQTAQPISPVKRSYWLVPTMLFGWFLRNIWQRLVTAGQGPLKLPGSRYLATSIPVSRGLNAGGFLRRSAAVHRSNVAAKASCPYLKLENNRGQALNAIPARSRCSVNGQPERVASTYQMSFCRVPAYRKCPRFMAVTAIPKQKKPESFASGFVKGLRREANALAPTIRELFHYPLAVAGLVVILVLIGVSIYTVIAIPYSQAVKAWLPQTEEKYLVPKNALPTWVNYFRKVTLPPTIVQNSANGGAVKVFTPGSNGMVSETITYTLDYNYGAFPDEMLITFNGQYVKKPFVSLTWTAPDGREFKLGNFSAVSTQRYLASEDIPSKYLAGQTFQSQSLLPSNTGGPSAVQVLFKDPSVEGENQPLKGRYTLRIDTTLFEENSNLDAELVFYGKVFGLAGTDDLRRDLMVPLLWGTPIALAFGFLGAITTCLLSMIIAAVGVWYGGWLDNLIQRLTEINMILPTLPIAIMIYYLYSKSIWVILGVIIILSIFGSAIKTYRAAFLQVKQAGYIEAAQAYGASNWRIIRYYLVPRIIPLLIPQLVILVPSYVFFETTLAYLGISDLNLPTWGKVISDAISRGAYHGYYYWFLEPLALIVITGLAFAVVGFALDSILNPKLRKL